MVRDGAGRVAITDTAGVTRQKPDIDGTHVVFEQDGDIYLAMLPEDPRVPPTPPLGFVMIPAIISLIQALSLWRSSGPSLTARVRLR